MLFYLPTEFIKIQMTQNTRNQANRKVPWVRIPPPPPEIRQWVPIKGETHLLA